MKSGDTRVESAAPEEPDWGADLFDNALEFVDNPEPRCLCMLVLDTSRSMEGAPLAALHRGLHVFREQLLEVPLASKRVEVGIVTIGSPVELIQDFILIDRFQPPVLTAQGETPLGTAILLALDTLEARKTCCRDNGVPYTRPWVFLITDGMPQGEELEVTRRAMQRIREAEAGRKVAFFAVGVQGANMKLLSRLSVRPPLHLDGLRFSDLFAWLSASTARAATSPGEESFSLPDIDWGTT